VRTEHLVESTPALLQLTDAEVDGLSQAGRSLASNAAWWGGDGPVERSVIHCQPAAAGRWTIRVQDAIGVVSVGTTQLVIHPKIPLDHLLLLFSESLQSPRLAEQRASVAPAASFWEIVARWFVAATQRVLRRDLSRDYQECSETLRLARGTIRHLPTTRAVLAGRLEISCTFDDFTIDTPLNRVLAAASRAITASMALPDEVRRDASRLLAHMRDVGPLRPWDLRHAPDRRTSHYGDAVVLASHVLRNVGRSVSGGDQASWTFLVRTPELVEAGVRAILRRSLHPTAVYKRGRRLKDTNLTITPDLVFGDAVAIGDIKYKVATDGWSRADLYEVVAFAEEFRTHKAALVFFGRAQAPCCLTVGDISVHRLLWDLGARADEASLGLGRAVRTWLDLAAN
jgi:5-methylcytosine-specific restriction enzyme subunit McrC